MQVRLKYYFLIFAGLCLTVSLNAQVNRYSLNSSNEQLDWRIKSSTDVGNQFDALKESGFDDADWVIATVPGTVYGSYVEQGLEETPEYGDNVYQDRVDGKGIYEDNYWYRTEFEIPSHEGFNHVWLNLAGINRDADVYFNGHLLGSIHGHVYRGKYDITEFVQQGPNTLALLVYVPIPPMNCSASPTYIASASWDWMPYVPDLNMGITDEVFLSFSNDVTMIDP